MLNYARLAPNDPLGNSPVSPGARERATRRASLASAATARGERQLVTFYRAAPSLSHEPVEGPGSPRLINCPRPGLVHLACVRARRRKVGGIPARTLIILFIDPDEIDGDRAPRVWVPQSPTGLATFQRGLAAQRRNRPAARRSAHRVARGR